MPQPRKAKQPRSSPPRARQLTKPLAECSECGLRIAQADTPLGVAAHDCAMVLEWKSAAPAAGEEGEETPLLEELHRYIRARMAEKTLSPQDAARIIVMLAKQSGGSGDGISPQLAALMVN